MRSHTFFASVVLFVLYFIGIMIRRGSLTEAIISPGHAFA